MNDDERLLKDILEESDPLQLAEKIRMYYRDKDRAERTSRSYMYFHMGMLTGAILKLTSSKPDE